MYATNFFENKMLMLLKGESITPPTNMYLALYQSDPTDTGTGGLEVTYTGYARRQVNFTEPAAEGNGLSMSNTSMITFPEVPVTSGSVNYVAVMDNPTIGSGNMWLYGKIEPGLSLQAGVSPVFRANTVKWIWSGNLSTYYRTKIMKVLAGVSRPTCAGFTPYIALCNGNPTGSGNEFSGNNYTRIPVEFTNPAQQTSGAGMVQNTQDILSGVASGNWGDLDTVAIYDASSQGNAFAVLPLGTSYRVITGYAVGFHQGGIQFNVN